MVDIVAHSFHPQLRATVIDADMPLCCAVLCSSLHIAQSRRSHLSSLSAAVAARCYGLSSVVQTFSAGTEATAFYPSAVAALESVGFGVGVELDEGGTNPVYTVDLNGGRSDADAGAAVADGREVGSAAVAAVSGDGEAQTGPDGGGGSKIRCWSKAYTGKLVFRGISLRPIGSAWVALLFATAQVKTAAIKHHL